jgi:hypothetical protein
MGRSDEKSCIQTSWGTPCGCRGGVLPSSGTRSRTFPCALTIGWQGWEGSSMVAAHSRGWGLILASLILPRWMGQGPMAGASHEQQGRQPIPHWSDDLILCDLTRELGEDEDGDVGLSRARHDMCGLRCVVLSPHCLVVRCDVVMPLVRVLSCHGTRWGC